MALLTIDNLHVRFRTPAGLLHAVNGVNLQVDRGEIVGLVGESGCGKSVTARAIMRLLPEHRSAQVSGRVVWRDEDLLAKSETDMVRLRGADLAMIFQDPLSALNPVMRIGDQVIEGPRQREKLSRQRARARAIEWLDHVGIPDAAARVDQYPHTFSGGMRQRVVMATALSGSPDLLIADEPTTALDVTIQAQLLERLRTLQAETGTAILFITHDLAVVAQLCHRVAVMYAGRIVEQATVAELFAHPRHPYTRALLNSTPVPGQRERLEPIPGAPPDGLHPFSGCPFADRCPHAIPACDLPPPLEDVTSTHRVACHRHEELADP